MDLQQSTGLELKIDKSRACSGRTLLKNFPIGAEDILQMLCTTTCVKKRRIKKDWTTTTTTTSSSWKMLITSDFILNFRLPSLGLVVLQTWLCNVWQQLERFNSFFSVGFRNFSCKKIQ